MIIGFKYKGFEPDDHVVTEAEETLDHIQDLAPIDATIVALLDYDGSNYACSVDIFVRNGSIFASVSNEHAGQALRRAEETIIEKLRKVKEARFFRRKPMILIHKSEAALEPLKQT